MVRLTVDGVHIAFDASQVVFWRLVRHVLPFGGGVLVAGRKIGEIAF
ncbi:MAG: hypothetical protein ACR2NF_08835 [Pirellulales bacterium]